MAPRGCDSGGPNVNEEMALVLMSTFLILLLYVSATIKMLSERTDTDDTNTNGTFSGR